MANNQRVVVQKMALNKIKLGKNSRLSVSKEELDGLMQSIKEVGLLQPIGVAKNGTGYEICYGNRRFMACSKLGYTNIPVIVHDHKKESELDLKNLTENLQRRNITLQEAGRYMDLLGTEGLTHGEMAIRLGVPKNYIDSCLRAFKEVPKDFRGDLDIRVSKDGRTKAAPGKIAISTAKEILAARRQYKLNETQVSSLFKAAKSEQKFSSKNVKAYASAIANGHADFMKKVSPTKTLHVNILVDESHYEFLHDKHVTNGPFRSVSALLVAVLEGKKSEKIKVLKTY